MNRALLAAMLIAGCREQRTPPPAPAQATHSDPALLRALTVLATSHAPAPAAIEQIRRDIDGGNLTLAGYIDRLVASDAFAAETAPLIVLRQLLAQNALGAPEGFVLQHTAGASPVYYLDKPCAADKAIAVRPWWRLVTGDDTPIAVCPDAYRPEVWTAAVPKGEPETACLSETAQVSTQGCGCGPSLMRCFESGDHQMQFAASLRAELRRSVEYNAAHALPLEQIFTSNETVRDRNAELLQRSYAAEAARRAPPETALRELATWPADGKWAPRAELATGQNAGILTAPDLIHYQLDRRQRMTTIYDILWCIEADSVGATPETLLGIMGNDLQIKSDGWKQLAGRPICTNCHARLDYGFQFFWGFPNDNLQAFYTPALQKSGRGPLYVHDADDVRGEAELTPAGFARLAVAQPEFRHCMARDFGEYVLGNQVTPDQVAAIEAAIKPNATTARELMRVALHAFVATWPAHPATPRPPAPSHAPRTEIAIDGPLKTQLAHCLDCHDHAPGRLDLSANTLDRKSVVAMLEAVAFGRMPKDAPLGEADRTAFLDAFIRATWSAKDADVARAYYVDRDIAVAAYRPEIAFALVHDLARGTSSSSWRLMENAVRGNLQQLTPGFATVTSLVAIEACHAARTARAERDRCIAEALELANLTSHAPRH